MEMSLTKLLVIAFVVLVVFGSGKLPGAMKDLGKGIRNFKKGLNEVDEEEGKASSKKTIEYTSVKDNENTKV